MLGRPHRLRVRVKITAVGQLFESGCERRASDGVPATPAGDDTVVGAAGPETAQSRDGSATP
jgi:hypothetical protein